MIKLVVKFICSYQAIYMFTLKLDSLIESNVIHTQNKTCKNTHKVLKIMWAVWLSFFVFIMNLHCYINLCKSRKWRIDTLIYQSHFMTFDFEKPLMLVNWAHKISFMWSDHLTLLPLIKVDDFSDPGMKENALNFF